jgi:pimeloyl-ACP methyl ester carboxylesterase
MHSGFDGWAEELHHTGALAAQERGYTVITFDGPGQGRPCYDGLVFRPDWETVVSPVIDWAAARPEVDPARIALAGYSMGGGLAPRAAAFEPRIAALICIDGIYDIGQAYTGRLGLGADTERRLTAESDPELDAMAQQMMQDSSLVRWACRQGMWSFGIATPRAFLAASLAYNLRDGIAEKITCPVFVGRGESDEFFLGQPEELMAHLTAAATLASFTDAEGAGAHCQAGAQRLLCARIPGQLMEPHSTATSPSRVTTGLDQPGVVHAPRYPDPAHLEAARTPPARKNTRSGPESPTGPAATSA